MKFFISAGEASGDLYGAQLIVALRRRARADDEPLEFVGVGGEKMRAAGCETYVDARHLAVVGMTEIVGRLPKIYSEFRKLLRAVDSAAEKPAAAVVIDSPAFNFRVARELHRRGVPVIYFVAPQLWAWREYRIERVQNWIKKVLCIFPFEEEFYQKHGVEVEYVGHPLADLESPRISREEYAREYGLDPARPWVSLLPGSRDKEVRATAKTMINGCGFLLGDGEHEFLLPLAPGLRPGTFLRSHSQGRWKLSKDHPVTVTIVHDARAALFHSRAAVVTSGTATVEAALMGTPFIAVYRLSPLTFFAARKMVKVPYVAMPNLIAGRRIVPELLQSEFTPRNVATELKAILRDGVERQQMIADLVEVCGKLCFRGARGQTAIGRAADAVMRLLPPKEGR